MKKLKAIVLMLALSITVLGNAAEVAADPTPPKPGGVQMAQDPTPPKPGG